MRYIRLCIALTVVGSACTHGDGGAPPDRAPDPLQVTVGTGERGVFMAVPDGETLRLQRGCQGSQHVFTSLRVFGARDERLRVQVRIQRAADEQVVSAPLDLRLPTEEDPEPGFVRITGLTPVIEAPRDVLGKEVIVSGSVQEQDGAAATATLRGLVEWGPDSCGASSALGQSRVTAP